MIRAILIDIEEGQEAGTIARKFHNTLAESIVDVAQRCGEQRIVLTGGCFQNRLLTEITVQRLRQTGFQVFWHREVPPNDGGISLGQAAVARAVARES